MQRGTAQAWPVSRVRKVLEGIAAKIASDFSSADDSTPDIVVRQKCLDVPDARPFHAQHPQLYWMVTDRSKMKEPKYRATIGALLELRSRVENGYVKEGPEADATATRVVMDALK